MLYPFLTPWGTKDDTKQVHGKTYSADLVSRKQRVDGSNWLPMRKYCMLSVQHDSDNNYVVFSGNLKYEMLH